MALSLWTFSACTDDLSDMGLLGSRKGDVVITTPAFEQVVKAETRTVITPKKDIVEVRWAENDKIGIVPDGGSQIYFDVNPYLNITDVAVFDGRAWNLRDFATYYAYYPYSNINNDDSISAGNIHFPPVEQIIKDRWDNTEHLSAADLLVGSGQQPENSALKIKFNHLCALVKFTLPVSKVADGAEIRQFLITVPGDDNLFIYDAEVDLTADHPELVARPGGSGKGWAVSFDKVTKKEGDVNVSFYGIMPPAALKNKTLEAQLTTFYKGERHVYKYSYDMVQDVAAGKAYDLVMNYESYDPLVNLAGTQVIRFRNGDISDSIVMVPIKPHGIQMGIIPDQPNLQATFDNHPITTSAYITHEYFIGQTEVTQGQWKTVMGELPGKQPIEDDVYPVVGMSFKQAEEFCARLTTLTGLRFHLPSDAQWQLAALSSSIASKGIASTPYPGSHNMDDVVVYAETAPHGHMSMALSGTPNGAGLYHMGGNVKEFIYNSYELPVNREVVNYFGPANSTLDCVVRGASWKTTGTQAVELSRVNSPGDHIALDNSASDEVGLRVVYANEIIQTVNKEWQFAYGYVDMGLPSGTLWATSDLRCESYNKTGVLALMDCKLDVMDGMNEKTKSSLASGTYFSFYNDKTGSSISTSNDDYRPSDPSHSRSLQGNTDLAIESNLGNNWLTPTEAQWRELFNNTDKSIEGDYVVLTSRHTGNQLYFKLSGYREGTDSAKDKGSKAYYWTSNYDPVSNFITEYFNGTTWTKAKLAIIGKDDKTTDRWGTSYKLKLRAILNPNTTKIDKKDKL